jgi:hypothetical protein
MASMELRIERLQAGFDFVERGGIEQFAQIRIAENFLKL